MIRMTLNRVEWVILNASPLWQQSNPSLIRICFEYWIISLYNDFTFIKEEPFLPTPSRKGLLVFKYEEKNGLFFSTRISRSVILLYIHRSKLVKHDPSSLLLHYIILIIHNFCLVSIIISLSCFNYYITSIVYIFRN